MIQFKTDKHPEHVFDLENPRSPDDLDDIMEECAQNHWEGTDQDTNEFPAEFQVLWEGAWHKFRVDLSLSAYFNIEAKE